MMRVDADYYRDQRVMQQTDALEQVRGELRDGVRLAIHALTEAGARVHNPDDVVREIVTAAERALYNATTGIADRAFVAFEAIGDAA